MTDPIRTVEGCLAAYNRHDAADFASYFADDGTLRVVATGEINEGREQIRHGADERWRVLDYTLDRRGLFRSGSDVWLEWTLHGTHIGESMGIPATHRSVEVLGCSHFTLNADGLIARDLVYFDFATMLRQLGVLPELEATSTT
jgi:steroid delta-isomerase-like uncharacterized protein